MTATGPDVDSVASGHAHVRIQRRVEWPDTDAAGHYHHSAVLRWVEAAEAVLFERLGVSELFGAIPRVRYEVDYLTRLWFGDVVDITIAVAEAGRTSVTYVFEVRRGAERAGTGRMVAVQIDQGTGDTVPWAEIVRDRFLTAGEQRPELLV